MKAFSDLTEREILALAISSEEEDGRIYMSFAEDLAERYPASAEVFERMSAEESSTAIFCSSSMKSASARICRRSGART